MKASELRLGNYICVDGKRIHRVSCVEWDYIKTDHHFTVFINPAKGELRGAPIPLTEEWLVRFGFDGDYQLVKESIVLSWGSRIVRTGERSSFYLDGDIPDSWKIRITYVHQLQNLYFALTGEELKATTDV